MGSGFPVGSIEALLEAIPDVMVRIDPKGRLIDVRFSRAIQDPGPEESWVGRSFDEILPPADASSWHRRVGRCLETGELQCERLQLDIEESDYHRVYEIRLARVSDQEVVALARDVTEQEEARKREAASRKLLAGITVATPLVLYIYDLTSSSITYANRDLFEELGYGKEQHAALLQAPAERLLHAEDLGQISDLLERLKSVPDGQCVERESRLRASDGSWVWFRARVSIFSRTPEGEPSAIFGALEEITERRELERQVSQSEKLEAVGEVAASIAHDFNNQLTAVGVYAELLACEVADDPEAARYAGLVLAAVDRASGLTKKLVSFSRATPRLAGVLDLCAFVVDFAPLLQKMVGPRVEVLLDSLSDPALIEIDSSELEQVVVNLAINARDAMPDGGSLTLSVQARDSEVPPEFALVVSDTGAGMPEEVRSRAFDPFFTTKSKLQGTGLGLASVDRIVVAAGGSVEVSSAVGKGSTFTLCFPQVGAAVSTASQGEERARQTVLLVEDDPVIRQSEKEQLEAAGYAVLVAVNAGEALNLAAAHPFDLLVTDVLMPGMTGPELAANLVAARPGLPVLYVSGYVGPSQIGDLGQLLSKPFTSESLVAAVRGALERSRVSS